MPQAAYISHGEHIGFYTLRLVSWGPTHYKDSYITHMANDWDRAWNKFQEYIARTGFQSRTCYEDQFDLNEWGAGGSQDWSVARYHEWSIRFAEGVMPFGKNLGVAIADLPWTYRVWLRGEAKDKVANGSKFVARSWQLVVDALAPFEDADAALTRARDGEKAIAEAAENERKAKAVHVGEIGKRMQAELTCTKVIQFAKQPMFYGDSEVGFIHIFRDAAGNTLKTFGKSPVGEGETALLKFTPKDHQEYKGEKQTMIGRLAVAVTKVAKKGLPKETDEVQSPV